MNSTDVFGTSGINVDQAFGGKNSMGLLYCNILQSRRTSQHTNPGPSSVVVVVSMKRGTLKNSKQAVAGTHYPSLHPLGP